MSIASLSWVRNEADIIEAFVRHHCRLVDRMVIIDNDSEDDTLAILRSLEQEGLPLEVQTDASTAHRQPEALTPVMHALAKDPATEWILPLDADEFLCSDGPLDATLRNLPLDAITLLPWRTYMAYPPTEQSVRALPWSLRYRRSHEPITYSKVLIPRALALPTHVLAMGNHALLGPDEQSLPAQMSTVLWLAHFPVRSQAQFVRKTQDGWERFQLFSGRKPGQSYHWQEYAQEFASQPPSAERLLEISATYAVPSTNVSQCPLPVFEPLSPVS